MIRRADITVSDSLGTPEPGVYITVKNSLGALATIYDDSGIAMANPFTSGTGGAFAYNISDTDQGTYTEEYRLSLSEGPRKTIAVDLSIAGAAAVRNAATRTALAALSTALPAYLTELGREGSFVHYTVAQYLAATGRSLAADIAADTAQGIFVATGTGAWVRQWDQSRAKTRWWGGTWDGVANDGLIALAALTTLFALAGSNLTGYGTAAPSLVFPFTPAGVNMGSTTLSLTKAIALYGETGGTIGGAASWLKWTGNCNGIEVRAANCYFDGLGLKGPWTTGSPAEGEYHAIKGYQKFGYGRLYIDSWRGDGIHINITAGSGGDTEGNCNGTYGHVLAVLSCRKAVSLEGSDVNACSFGFIDANYCRQAAVWEASGLGNSYGAVQTSGNGVTGYGTPCICYNNGFYFTVANGQAAAASTNGPPATATNNPYWIYWKTAVGASAFAPQWISGLTWREGGAFFTPVSMASNVSAVDYLYVESDQPPVQASQSVLFKGGINGGGWGPATRYIAAGANGITAGPAFYCKGNFVQEFGAGGEFRIDGSLNGNANDLLLSLIAGNTATTINFKSAAGGLQTDASIASIRGQALFLGHTTEMKVTIGGTFLAGFGPSYLYPGTDNSFDLGYSNAAFRWRNVFAMTADLATQLKIAGTKVVGARDTGWTADTGTAKKTATATYAPGANLTYSAAYVQAEQTATSTRLQAIEPALRDATQEIKALKDALIAHGMIGA